MLRHKVIGTIRSAAILTSGYVAATTISNSQMFNHASIGVLFTIGNLTDLQIKVEYSDDNSTFRQETNKSISGGVTTETAAVHKYTATGNFELPIDTSAPYIKISAIGTGDATNSSLALTAALSVR